MKYTTAKTILKIYRKEGRFGKKKQRNKKKASKAASPATTENPPNATDEAPCNVSLRQELYPEAETRLTGGFWGRHMAEHFA